MCTSVPVEIKVDGREDIQVVDGSPRRGLAIATVIIPLDAYVDLRPGLLALRPKQHFRPRELPPAPYPHSPSIFPR